jgi:hypothetical protein
VKKDTEEYAPSESAAVPPAMPSIPSMKLKRLTNQATNNTENPMPPA